MTTDPGPAPKVSPWLISVEGDTEGFWSGRVSSALAGIVVVKITTMINKKRKKLGRKE
jgi:hypothetical protein